MRAGSAVFLLLFCVACQAPPSQQLTEDQIAEIEAAVMESIETYADGYREMDMEKVASVAHPDLLTYPFAGRVLDRPGFLESSLAWAEGKESWAINWTDVNVRVISQDLAVFSGTSVDTVTFSDGRAFYYPSNAYGFLFERTPQGWKFSVGGPSSPPRQAVDEG